MLSNLSLRIIAILVEFGRAVRILPWKWDSANHTLTVAQNYFNFFGLFKIQNFGFKVVSICYYLNFCFGLFRLVQSIYWLDLDFQNIMFQVLINTVNLLGVGLNLNTIWKAEDVGGLYTNIIQNDEKLTKLYQTQKVFDRAVPYCIFFATLGVSEIPALVILYLANTAKPCYLGSLKFYVPREYWKLRQAVELVSVFIELEFIFVVVLTSLCYALAFITFTQTTAFWMDELRPFLPEVTESRKRKQVIVKRTRPTKPVYRTFEVAKANYRGFQVLAKHIDSIVKVALTTAHFSTAGLLVLCTFSTINFWGWHNFETIKTAIGYLIFPAAVAIFGTWIIVIEPQPAALKDRCPIFRKEWKQKVKLEVLDMDLRAEGIKWLNSCGDMTFEVGNLFIYQTSTMPAVMSICVDNLINLLLF